MNLYSKRRKKLISSIKGNAAILLFSNKAVMCSEDESYPFKVNRNFYYLTGLDFEGMSILIKKIDGVVSETLFIQPFDAKLARWVGGRILAQDAMKICEVDDVRNVDELDECVAHLLDNSRRDNEFKLYFDLWHYNMDQENSDASNYALKLRSRYPYIIIKDVFPYLTSMRLVKDDYEIKQIKEAIHITNKGIQAMMKLSKDGVSEMAMEGAFDYELRKNMCHENAFATIAASGKRATILHYSNNNQTMQDGELFLCDLGATSNHYCADISRTFPVNGKFTARQKEIYQLVLNAQKITEKYAKEGASLKDINQKIVDYYKKELPKHGLKKDVREYYFHSISHHLGLDTHDVDGGMGRVLKQGNVITNEPGLYIEDEGIGIRIEDDLLITKGKPINLSSEIIKEIDDIERFMKQ